MNYRHHFHAGNFADLYKHAALSAALAALQRHPEPLLLVDTHAGAGAYELDFRSMRDGEAAAAKRLGVDEGAPAVFDRLKRVMREEGARLRTPVYPGSPLLMAGALRRGDRLVAFELRPDDHAALDQRLRRTGARAEARLADGYKGVAEVLGRAAEHRVLVLIDPPYERGDDYARAVAATHAILAVAPGAVVLLWAPIKDLETLDRMARELEALTPAPRGLVGEVRLRPLTDPMRLNGCALVAINPPEGLEAAMNEAGAWIAARLGDTGGSARVWPLAG